MRNEITEDILYISLEEAKEEMWQRWYNLDLRKKALDFIGNIPRPLQEAPRAVLSRYIATPNFEFFHFAEVANKTELLPLVTEYIRDKFVLSNIDKLCLGEMPLYKRRDKNGHIIFEYKKIIDCTAFQGKPIGEIMTLWGEPLVDFHHRLLPTSLESIHLDVSAWCESNGGHAESYYQNFLALFICHGILFENFITNEEEDRFSKSVVFPAFKQVVDHFGIKPLIVPLVPHETASDIYWRCYPAELEEEVVRCLSKVKDSSGRQHAAQRNGKDSGSKRDKN